VLCDEALGALLPGVAATLARLRQRGVLIVAATDRLALGEAQVRRLRELAGGTLAGVYVAAGKPASWSKPRPGMLLAAARELEVDLAQSWVVGTAARDAVAAGQAGCAGAVLVGGAVLPTDDLGITVAAAADLADAPRVMIPRGGGCWHDQR
jgi:histidinol phosphatase-like enzyme